MLVYTLGAGLLFPPRHSPAAGTRPSAGRGRSGLGVMRSGLARATGQAWGAQAVAPRLASPCLLRSLQSAEAVAEASRGQGVDAVLKLAVELLGSRGQKAEPSKLEVEARPESEVKTRS